MNGRRFANLLIDRFVELSELAGTHMSASVERNLSMLVFRQGSEFSFSYGKLAAIEQNHQ